MKLSVKTSNGGYDIILKRGAIKKLDEVLNLKRRVLIVTDSGVPEIYSKTVAEQCAMPFIYTIEEGEASKNFDNFKNILSFLLENGFTRSDCVVAVGGGVVGDLAGFTASAFMRGIEFYNIPTTLLSQVDSSVGGKTAIDFMGYKNIVGAFYPPACVVIDPEVLNTLAPRQISNGLAEALKMSLTSSRELFNVFESGEVKDNIDLIIEKAIKIKKYVVEEDEKEADLRKVLNFGHTVGHAIEVADENLYHGECVALGMLYMCSDKVKNRLLPILEKLNLPTKTDLQFSSLFEAISHDKKMSGDKITVVYVEEIGSFKLLEMSYKEFLERIEKGGFNR